MRERERENERERETEELCGREKLRWQGSLGSERVEGMERAWEWEGDEKLYDQLVRVDLDGQGMMLCRFTGLLEREILAKLHKSVVAICCLGYT